MNVCIIPQPNNYSLSDEKINIGSTFKIVKNDFSESQLTVFFNRGNFKLSEFGFELSIIKDKNLSKEEYKLELSKSNIILYSLSESGVYNGLTTLYQLIKLDEVFVGSISDCPRYLHRGIQLDPCRHFFDIDEVKKIVEAISLVKMNVLHLHLSDDQGWRIESESYPLLHKKSIQYYTKSQIRDLIKYCRERNVEIIPEFDMPGHMSALVSAYPNFSCFSQDIEIPTKGGIYPHILCPSKDIVYEMVENLIKEYSELFPSKKIHLGGDEAYKLNWRSCPLCVKKMFELGIKEIKDLQGYFMNKVQKIANKYGKTVIYWDDALTSNNLEEGYISQFWSITRKTYLQEFVKKGGKLIYSDMFSFYFDYPSSMTPLKKVYTSKLELGNMDVSDNIEGIECCHWSERIYTNSDLEKKAFPRCLAVAEKAWTVSLNYESFLKRLDNLEPLFNVKFLSKDMYDPSGKSRHDEAIGYLREVNRTNAEFSDESMKESMSFDFIKGYMGFFKPTDYIDVIKELKKGK